MRILTALMACMALVAWFDGQATAEVDLPAILSDNMVLQRGATLPIWGKAAPGEKVTVIIAGQTCTADAGADGMWKVMLNPLEAGGPFEMSVAGETNTLVVRNILVGEVWFASGQSNMAFEIRRAKDSEKEITAADYPEIRLCRVVKVTAETPQFDCKCQWVECSPKTVPTFSAVAYCFARDLHEDLNIPVGVIDNSWSGSVAEAWISSAPLEAEPELAPLLERWQTKVEGFDQAAADAEYEKQIARWQEASREAEAAGRSAPERPERPMNFRLHRHRPSNLFNAMVAPVMPFGIRGVIWYQGESNAGRANQYRLLFPVLIRDWRRHWGEGDFPFLFVQLANFQSREEPTGRNWAELREAQTSALSLPATGMAVAVDIGEADNIHPKNKQEVARRLSLVARAKVYGEQIVYSGPLYSSMEVEGSAVRLTFAHVGSGLVSKDGKPLRCFAVAGEDRVFHPGDAKIDGDTIVVSSKEVSHPAAVRYAWQNDPGDVNFYNADGLPASPFRTDNWPRITTTRLWPTVLD